MDKLQACAVAFEHLLSQEYHIIAGKKGKTVTIHLSFSPDSFHHLLGLHKLIDLRLAKEDRASVFSKILSGKITLSAIEKSRYFNGISNRLEALTHLEALLDSNEIIFKYHENQNNWSRIQAKFLLISFYQADKIYIFIDQGNNPLDSDAYFCRSFFPYEETPYEQQQPRYTLLYKEKIDCLSGASTIQYNRLKKQPTAK